MTQIAPAHEIFTTGSALRRPFTGRLGVLLAASLLVLGGALSAPLPAHADPDGGANDRDEDYGGDHAGVYQAQRGEVVCESREECGGAEAIPMNQPGYFYGPAGSGRTGRR